MPLGTQAQKYTRLLDATLRNNPKTNDLNMNQNLVGEFVGVGTVQIAKIALQGLGDYDRKNGFVEGDITTEWEPVALEFDRGREFSIDAMDDEERLGIVTTEAMGSFANDFVIPEVDAIRFARLCAKAGTIEQQAITTPDDALEVVLDAEAQIEDLGISISECIFYATGTMKSLLRKATQYRFGRAENPNTNFQTFDDMKLVIPNKKTFVTAIETRDGKTSGQTAGGFVKATGAADINFMIVHPSAAAAVTKHEKMRYFSPDVNQAKDAHKWQYRLFHDMFIYDNKAELIIASHA